jgi:hypothetical protein
MRQFLAQFTSVPWQRGARTGLQLWTLFIVSGVMTLQNLWTCIKIALVTA